MEAQAATHDPELLQWLWRCAWDYALGPANGVSRLYWVYVLSFVALAALSYRLYAPRGACRWRNFLAFCFPRRLYLHRSALVDYQITLANGLLGGAGWLLGGVTVAGVATASAGWLEAWLGPVEPGPRSSASLLGFTLAAALAADFARYVSHALQHRVPVLWQLHKVHHSAEVLTPVTHYRRHPLATAFGALVGAAVAGPIQGALAYVFLGEAQLFTLFGLNACFALFLVAGANLRHSHIWLSFGPLWSRLFVSPAQHQIHHSAAPEHADRNLGEIFAVWDWLFGTLYVPRVREELRFGIAGEAVQPHASLLEAYLRPLVAIGRLAAPGPGRLAARLADASGRPAVGRAQRGAAERSP